MQITNVTWSFDEVIVYGMYVNVVRDFSRIISLFGKLSWSSLKLIIMVS